MKKNIFLFILLSLNLNAQSLKFDKISTQCEDKWIAYQMNKDSTYTFGYIYIDSQAGLTFNYEGKFKIDNEQKFNIIETDIKKDKVSLKARLEPNRIALAEIPESKYKELNIQKVPDWLKFYKTDENTIERLFKWGFMYNGWEECGKALEYLEKAKKIDQNFKGLKVELAYSYNCLGRYNDAVEVLQEALKIQPNDAYINKELIFSQSKLNQIDVAESSFKKALKLCEDKTYNAENAFQIVQGYFIKKDKLNFERFLNEFSVLLKSDNRFPPIIEQMKLELKK